MLDGIIEALGFGAAREARLLVARLPAGLTVATADDRLVRALARGSHRPAPLGNEHVADAALALGLPEGDDALALLQKLVASTRQGGIVHVALTPNIGLSSDRGRRARIAGLFLRAGLVDLTQEVDGGIIYTAGRVNRVGAA